MYDDKITFVKTNFSHAAFENLSDNEKSKLSETAQDLFSFFESICYAT